MSARLSRGVRVLQVPSGGDVVVLFGFARPRRFPMLILHAEAFPGLSRRTHPLQTVSRAAGSSVESFRHCGSGGIAEIRRILGAMRLSGFLSSEPRGLSSSGADCVVCDAYFKTKMKKRSSHLLNRGQTQGFSGHGTSPSRLRMAARFCVNNEPASLPPIQPAARGLAASSVCDVGQKSQPRAALSELRQAFDGCHWLVAGSSESTIPLGRRPSKVKARPDCWRQKKKKKKKEKKKNKKKIKKKN